MENPKTTTAGQGLGIAGLILGILSIPLATMGCTFVTGLVLGITGITLSAVGLSQAKKANAPYNLILAALIVSIIGCSLAVIRMSNSFIRKAPFRWEDMLEKIEWVEEKTEEYEDDFEEGFEEGFGGDLEETLQELEEDLDETFEDLEEEFEGIELTDEDIEKAFEGLSDEEKARKIGRAAGKALREFVDEVTDTNNVEEE